MVALLSASVAAEPLVSAGPGFALAIRGGAVVGWGSDRFGELAQPRSVRFASTPVRVPGLSDIVAIANGQSHSLAVNSRGEVFAWGTNDQYQLGNGSTIASATPSRVAALPRIRKVEAYGGVSLALDESGVVWIWGTGFSESGLGPGGKIPAPMPGATNICDMELGFFFGVLRDCAGRVFTWGTNGDGQLGDGSTRSRSGLAQVAGLGEVAAIAAGERHAIALLRNGELMSWGGNADGQLGSGTTASRTIPGPVLGAGDIVSVGAFFNYNFAVHRDGRVFGWGRNLNGQIMQPGGSPILTAVPVSGLQDIASVAVGSDVVFVRRDGTALHWNYRQLTPLASLGRLLLVSSTGNVLLVDARQEVYAMGNNQFGQLGQGDQFDFAVPRPVGNLNRVTHLATGRNISLALTGDGELFAWGTGNGINTPFAFPNNVSSTPRRVELEGRPAQIAAGGSFGVVLLADGRVQAWGFNGSGQAGSPDFSTAIDKYPPANVPNVPPSSRIAAGGQHGLALALDGTVWTWGNNSSGQLGGGTGGASRHTAARVPGIDDVVAVAGGRLSSYALRRDGTVWVWGVDLSTVGEPSVASPRQLPSLAGIVAIAPSDEGNHVLALDASGGVWAWGRNSYGQLGDGTFEDRRQPVMLRGLPRVVEVSAANDASYAVFENGAVAAWGRNLGGTVGDGTFAVRSRPTAVVGLNANDYLGVGERTSAAPPSTTLPPITLVTESTGANYVATLNPSATQGNSTNIYVFALAPAVALASGAPKDGLTGCVLAQLTASGQLQAVSGDTLAAYVSNVISGQTQTVSLLHGVNAAQVAGATFYVGYGNSPSDMLDGGTSRSAVSVPGAVECKPEAPATGWWWNPAEDGRGYSIEVQGNNLFFASFLYDVSGRSTWYVASGPTSLDGSLFTNRLYAARGGQTLGGAYPGAPQLTNQGAVTLAFSSASTGTLVWPGGVVPIQRFNIVPGGLAQRPFAGQPESGWWWNEKESGRGFFLEWQGNTLDIAGYMYDEAGNPVWYLNVGEMGAGGRTFTGNWWSYGNGQTLTGAWKPHSRTSANVAPLTIEFSGPATAIMTLPNGRTTTLTRHRF